MRTGTTFGIGPSGHADLADDASPDLSGVSSSIALTENSALVRSGDNSSLGFPSPVPRSGGISGALTKRIRGEKEPSGLTPSEKISESPPGITSKADPADDVCSFGAQRVSDAVSRMTMRGGYTRF